MLSEAFSTPPGSRKTSLPQQEDHLTSEGSSSSLSAASNDNYAMKRHNSTGSIGVISPVTTEPPSTILNSKSDTVNSVSKSRAMAVGKADITNKTRARAVSDTTLISNISFLAAKPSQNNQRQKSDTSKTDPIKPVTLSRRGTTGDISGRPSSASTLGNKQKRRQLPAVRPVSAQPSRSLVRLAEQKKKEDEEKARAEILKASAEMQMLEQENNQTDTGVDEQLDKDKFSHHHELTESLDEGSESVPESSQVSKQNRVTPIQKKSLPVC